MLNFNLAVKGDDVENNLHYRFPVNTLTSLLSTKEVSLVLDMIELLIKEIENYYVQDLAKIHTTKWGILFTVSVDGNDFKNNLYYSITLPGGMQWFERNKDNFLYLLEDYMEIIKEAYFQDLLSKEEGLRNGRKKYFKRELND